MLTNLQVISYAKQCFYTYLWSHSWHWMPVSVISPMLPVSVISPICLSQVWHHPWQCLSTWVWHHPWQCLSTWVWHKQWLCFSNRKHDNYHLWPMKMFLYLWLHHPRRCFSICEWGITHEGVCLSVNWASLMKMFLSVNGVSPWRCLSICEWGNGYHPWRCLSVNGVSLMKVFLYLWMEYHPWRCFSICEWGIIHEGVSLSVNICSYPWWWRPGLEPGVHRSCEFFPLPSSGSRCPPGDRPGLPWWPDSTSPANSPEKQACQ